MGHKMPLKPLVKCTFDPKIPRLDAETCVSLIVFANTLGLFSNWLNTGFRLFINGRTACGVPSSKPWRWECRVPSEFALPADMSLQPCGYRRSQNHTPRRTHAMVLHRIRSVTVSHSTGPEQSDQTATLYLAAIMERAHAPPIWLFSNTSTDSTIHADGAQA